jgi:hypothetical protein
MRFNNQQNIDEEQLAAIIASNKSIPVIQFSEQSAYDGRVLGILNNLCQRFGAKIQVRFYGHYGGEFDCHWLRQIPEVRSLAIDCLMHAANIDDLNQLHNLEELTFGVYEADLPRLLEMSSLAGLRKLVLVDNRRNNIDLAPLATFSCMENLTLCGHTHHIEALANVGSIRRLALNQIRKNVRLDFIRSMSGLEALSIMLGGRLNLDEVSNERIADLHVIRVRGLEKINLEGFPSLVGLHVEDQLQIKTLGLEPATKLRRLTIFNCKQLHVLAGIQVLGQLEHLWLGRTSIDPGKFLALLPKALRAVSLSGYGSKRDQVLKERLRSLGYAEADYLKYAAPN